MGVALSLREKQRPIIKRLVLFCSREEGKQGETATNIQKAVTAGIEILYLPELIERGAGLQNVSLKTPEADDLCSIMYTSGFRFDTGKSPNCLKK